MLCVSQLKDSTVLRLGSSQDKPSRAGGGRGIEQTEVWPGDHLG